MVLARRGSALVSRRRSFPSLSSGNAENWRRREEGTFFYVSTHSFLCKRKPSTHISLYLKGPCHVFYLSLFRPIMSLTMEVRLSRNVAPATSLSTPPLTFQPNTFQWMRPVNLICLKRHWHRMRLYQLRVS